jgi:hypothetical protein
VRRVPDKHGGWNRRVKGAEEGEETHSLRCSRRITLGTDDASIA